MNDDFFWPNGILFSTDWKFERVRALSDGKYVEFTEKPYNASIVANLMDTLYLLINEPSVANSAHFYQHEDCADRREGCWEE